MVVGVCEQLSGVTGSHAGPSRFLRIAEASPLMKFIVADLPAAGQGNGSEERANPQKLTLRYGKKIDSKQNLLRSTLENYSHC